MSQKKQKKTNLEISDSRQFPDSEQIKGLGRQIETDGVIKSLGEVKAFFHRYSSRSPQELSINVVDGVLGEGTIKGNQIHIQLPTRAETISQLQKSLEPNFGETTEEVAGHLAFALATSTVLHEGVHGILDSTPTSQLAIDFERVSGIQNTGGEVVTLLDEGIAYAIQSRYAKEVEPIGILVPRISDQEDPSVKKRKALGEKLKPKVDEYIESDRKIDDDFLVFSSQAIKEVEDK